MRFFLVALVLAVFVVQVCGQAVLEDDSGGVNLSVRSLNGLCSSAGSVLRCNTSASAFTVRVDVVNLDDLVKDVCVLVEGERPFASFSGGNFNGTLGCSGAGCSWSNLDGCFVSVGSIPRHIIASGNLSGNESVLVVAYGKDGTVTKRREIKVEYSVMECVKDSDCPRGRVCASGWKCVTIEEAKRAAELAKANGSQSGGAFPYLEVGAALVGVFVVLYMMHKYM
ncbi:Uncharacterised protein [uncultured archaeon]|nr:Uncharacterised protein [uncultured archaeon]